MEAVNQFVSRHEYKGFIEKLGGKALNQQQVLDSGIGYSNWVSGFRDFIKAFVILHPGRYVGVKTRQ